MRNYQNLNVWKSAMRLVKNIYLLTRGYPKKEIYNLTSQTRRAAVSIAVNIAEGMGRQYKKDTLQFLHISRGSVYELETLLNIALMVEVVNELNLKESAHLIETTIKLLNGLINYYEKSDLK